MDHPRSQLPAVLAVLFCIALLAGVGVLLWKTLPEKQKPEQAETIQTDGVFSSEPTTVEPEREAPYEGELPDQVEAAQPETPDEQQPESTENPEVPDNMTVSGVTLESEFEALIKACSLTKQELETLVRNAAEACFAGEAEKAWLKREIAARFAE